VIVAAHRSDVWLGGLGLLMSGIAAAAIIARPKKTFLWLGVDSIALVVIYAVGIVFLTRVIN
jgi:cation:H+ antiporter